MPKKIIYNAKNPLAKYRSAHLYENWSDLAGQVGLSSQTLISIAKKDEQEIKKLSIETIEKIQNTFKVDLLGEWKN